MGEAKRTTHRVNYLKQYYIDNKEKELKRGKEHRLRNKLWLDEIKSQLPCIKCGEADIRCLDFHHRDPNEKDLAVGSMIKYSRKKILEEISKCDVLCANCHRKEHYQGV